MVFENKINFYKIGHFALLDELFSKLRRFWPNFVPFVLINKHDSISQCFPLKIQFSRKVLEIKNADEKTLFNICVEFEDLQKKISMTIFQKFTFFIRILHFSSFTKCYLIIYSLHKTSTSSVLNL